MFFKKVVGTLVMAGLALRPSTLFLSPEALATFIPTGGSVIADGVLTAVSADSITFQTSDGGTVTTAIGRGTSTQGGTLEVGHHVRVMATGRTGSLTARTIRTAGSPYGNTGPALSVPGAEIVSKGADTLVVATTAGNATIDITTATRFIRKSFAELQVGDSVILNGQDTGSAFVARTVIFRR